MAEVELLRKIADDVAHIKLDLEELKDFAYPAEERISDKAIQAVQESEKHYREGKFREFKSPEEIRKFFK